MMYQTIRDYDAVVQDILNDGLEMRGQREIDLASLARRLDAQMKWLRGALIYAEVRTTANARDGDIDNAMIDRIISGIDGNMAVAAERAVTHGAASETEAE